MENATENQGFFEVDGKWLTACGYGNQPKAFPVIRTYMSGHLPIVVVRLDSGREWELIASWRGRFI